MRYAKIEKNSIANGPGCRVVLWCQGCSIHCKGCHNPETWSFEQGKVFDKEAVSLIVEELSKPEVAGITFSGGHPLEPENILGCLFLSQYIRNRFPDKSIWLYTGLTLDIEDLINTRYKNCWKHFRSVLLNLCDVVVDGPFIQEEKDISLLYRGSKNQRLIDVKKTLEHGEIKLWKDKYS